MRISDLGSDVCSSVLKAAGAQDEVAALKDQVAHSAWPFAFGRRNQPVSIDRTSFTGPAGSTFAIGTMNKATSSHATMKWIERADCRPPNRSSSHGAVALKPGDMVSPVATISGNRMKITPIYDSFCRIL